MEQKNTKRALAYSALTLLITFIIGQILFILFSDGTSIGSTILFIFMNLTPMIVAIIFAKLDQVDSVMKKMFLQKENLFVYLMAIGSVSIYYGVSIALDNVTFTGGTFVMILSYLPWTILQGGLEECGWRWYLQPKLEIKSFTVKMLIISIIWFLWHIPVYRLPWITAGSSNYLIFYLMILGNTFMFGAIKEYSKGVLPCIIAHILIDSMAVAILVGSKMPQIIILVLIEIIVSTIVVKFNSKK
ncbi:CPBP family intramembrane glutamic endopeptidase [[Eubacterium] hominis]|uniref:CPBP family intramembrane glutamic endopeptidase n=1 Tax=[Eubacterium] hominis TaxID=2764325 RepID=UPI003A4D70ED